MGIAIRLATEDDAEQMLAIYAPIIRDTTISFELEPPGVEEFRRRIREVTSYAPWLVCERDGEVLGYAYASHYRVRAAYRWSVEGSLYVHHGYKRCGIGTALSASLFQCLRVLGYYNIYACIALPNEASVSNAERLGFKPVGVFHRIGYLKGRWCDVSWWEMRLQEYAPSPASPRSPQDVLGTKMWEEALKTGLHHIHL